MVGVCIITLVRNIGNTAEPILVNLCKTVTEAFCRCSIETKADAGIFLPGIRSFTQPVHDFAGKFHTFRIGMADTGH